MHGKVWKTAFVKPASIPHSKQTTESQSNAYAFTQLWLGMTFFNMPKTARRICLIFQQ